MDTYKGVIDEYPGETSTSILDYCVNRNLYDTNKKYLNEVNDIEIYEEGVETKYI